MTSEEQQVDDNILFEYMIAGFEGALLTLYCFNIVERISGTLAAASSTHPPPMLRFGRVMNTFRRQQSYTKEAADRIHHSMEICKLLDRVVPPCFERRIEEDMFKLLMYSRVDRIQSLVRKIVSSLRSGSMPQSNLRDFSLTLPERTLIDNLKRGLERQLSDKKSCADLLERAIVICMQ